MKKNGFMQYIPTFVMGLIFIGILAIVQQTNGTYFFTKGLEGSMSKTGLIVLDWVFVVLFAVAFTLIFLIVDVVTGKFKTKTKLFKEYEQKHFDDFVDKIGGELNKVKIFNVEDFRHFRENNKLQDCLKKLYQVYLYGETEEVNYFLILRKFQKGSNERTAIEYLVTFTEKERNANASEITQFLEQKKAFDEEQKIKAEKKAARKNKNK